MNRHLPDTVAVGGIGGSGTRLVACLLQMLGYYLGEDLNKSWDNLWFTLLFKRRSILLERKANFDSLVSLFFCRMAGSTVLSERDQTLVFRLADRERPQHSRDWLLERARSLTNGRTSRRLDQPWCWKEPNTHIVIDRIFECRANLRYIHVVRHPLDMVLSENQNQLQIWGPIFLEQDVVVGPRLSLSYWCAAHRRIMGFMQTWQDRTMMIDFDTLCMKPDACCVKIAGFVHSDLPDAAISKFCDFVRPWRPIGRFTAADLRQFDPSDLAYVAEIGYPLS